MAIILATVAMFLFHLPIATVGKIPQTLISSDRLTFAAFHLDSLKEVMVPAISIALLGMVESLLCGASAGRMANKPLDSNQELVAQGIGNLVLPFLEAFQRQLRLPEQVWQLNQGTDSFSWYHSCFGFVFIYDYFCTNYVKHSYASFGRSVDCYCLAHE